MFLGEHQHTIDAKGRVSVPARFRQELTGKLIVSRGFEDCLYIYPAERHQKFLDELVSGNDFDPQQRLVRRFFISGAVETDIDSAGRIMLPQTLRDFAGLTRDVVVAGNGDRIEVWDASAWADYTTKATGEVEEAARSLAEKGIR